MSYHADYLASIKNPEAFWAEKATQLDWYKASSHVLTTDEHGIQHWFADGELNTCSENLLKNKVLCNHRGSSCNLRASNR